MSAEEFEKKVFWNLELQKQPLASDEEFERTVVLGLEVQNPYFRRVKNVKELVNNTNPDFSNLYIRNGKFYMNNE